MNSHDDFVMMIPTRSLSHVLLVLLLATNCLSVCRSMQLSGVSADSFTAALLSDQPSLKHSSAAEFRQLVSAALRDHVIMMPCFENQLRKLHASVIEPAGKFVTWRSR